MKKYEDYRIVEAANIYKNEKCSIRQLVELVGIPRNTLSRNFITRLPKINRTLANEVHTLAAENKKDAPRRAVIAHKYYAQLRKQSIK